MEQLEHLKATEKNEIAARKNPAVESALGMVTNIASEFFHSAAYEGLQAPATGLSQIVDKIAGSDVASATHFISAPESASFGSITWHAQQIGGAIGQLVPFLLARRMVEPLMGNLVQGEIGAVARMPLGMSVQEGAATGFVSQALFHPVDENQNFWRQKLVNSSIGAITIATLTASSLGLNKSGLKNPILNGVISGAPAGVLSAELGALDAKGKAASATDIGQSIYTMSFIGGAFGALAQTAAGRATNDKGKADILPPAPLEMPPEKILLSASPFSQLKTGEQAELAFELSATEIEKPAAKELEEKKVESREKQLELEFPEPLTPTGSKAWHLLRQLEDLPTAENLKLGTKDQPVGIEELQAMVILKNEWLKGSHRLYFRLGERSPLARMIVGEAWAIESAGDVKDALPKTLEKSLIYSSESNDWVARDKFVGINRHYEEIGIKTEAEAKSFVDLYQRSTHYSPWLWGALDVDPVALNKVSKWSQLPQIPDDAIRGVTEHLYRTKQNPGSDHDVVAMVAAAPGWDVVPGMPIDMATVIAKLSPHEKVVAQYAFEKAAADFKSKDVSNYQIFTGDRAVEARAAYAKYYQESLPLSTRMLVKNLQGTFGTPNAVDALYGEKFDPRQKRELVIALDMFRHPLKLLATTDAPTFFEAYDKLVEKYPPEKDAEERRYFSWQNRTALVLSSLFKKNWQNWLDVQEKAGRNAMQATEYLGADEPANVKGLAQFLLEHGRKSPDQLGRIADGWSEVRKAETTDYQEALRVSLLARYKTIKNEPFAIEASRWNIGKEQYAGVEQRYLASLSVPSPFPLEKSWQSGSLTGRFIPRDDPRGLFLGEYSNCCQHPGGNAESSAWYGQENPRSGFFVVENAEHEVVAQSWAIATESGGIIFDNVEAKGIDKRQSAVRDIYQKAAQSLLDQFHTVTIGTENSDLDLAGMKAAGAQALSMPSDFSGYTDSKEQVLLASNNTPPLPVEFKMVRGATNLDKSHLARIAQDKFPDGWQHLPWERYTRGLVIQNSSKEIMGYALYEPSNHYVSDLAVKPGAHPRYGFLLTTNLLKEIKKIGGDWQADMRSTTSYRMLHKASTTGRVNILTDVLEGSLMGDDPMRHVVFNIPERGQAPPPP